MSIRIVFKGFSQELSAPERLALLSRACNGDRAKAEEALITPNYVLRTLASQAEVGLILPRLEKMGLLCEVVEGDEIASGGYQSHEVSVRMVTCQFCGYEQARAKVCRKCGKLFSAVKKIDWKPTVKIEAEEEVTDEAHVDSFMDRVRGWHIFTLRNAVIVIAILGVLAGFGIVSLPEQKPKMDQAKLEKLGITEEMLKQMSPEQIDALGVQESGSNNAVLMVMKGIVTSDPDEVKKTATYDPEDGTNPYAKRLESLGIDQKEFSKAAAGIEGPIEGAEVQGIIDSNEMLKGAIDDAVNSSAKSTGDTETDSAIDSIK
jgi:type II secretory pathway pseudopilin PulG